MSYYLRSGDRLLHSSAFVIETSVAIWFPGLLCHVLLSPRVWKVLTDHRQNSFCTALLRSTSTCRKCKSDRHKISHLIDGGRAKKCSKILHVFRVISEKGCTHKKKKTLPKMIKARGIHHSLHDPSSQMLVAKIPLLFMVECFFFVLFWNVRNLPVYLGELLSAKLSSGGSCGHETLQDPKSETAQCHNTLDSLIDAFVRTISVWKPIKSQNDSRAVTRKAFKIKYSIALSQLQLWWFK